MELFKDYWLKSLTGQPKEGSAEAEGCKLFWRPGTVLGRLENGRAALLNTGSRAELEALVSLPAGRAAGSQGVDSRGLTALQIDDFERLTGTGFKFRRLSVPDGLP